MARGRKMSDAETQRILLDLKTGETCQRIAGRHGFYVETVVRIARRYGFAVPGWHGGRNPSPAPVETDRVAPDDMERADAARRLRRLARSGPVEPGLVATWIRDATRGAAP